MKRHKIKLRVLTFLIVSVGIIIASVLWIANITSKQEKNLKASETCSEEIFTGDVEVLERLISVDTSFKSHWSRRATDSYLKLTCDNFTSSGSVRMYTEMRDGNRADWVSSLEKHDQAGRESNASRFKSGTEGLAWNNSAAIYAKCKLYSKGSSHTSGMQHPYLSVVITASGSSRAKDNENREDLAYLASKMLLEAKLQTGCQELSAVPSGPPQLDQ
ncbi:hypothetical protein [Streptomyces sp. Je 1-332]|uniref:hypothetical protein n=1 Tax=Streptomyces sp. Je 1-332 TaxID=3231270 RepID=UPI003457435D